MSVRCNIATFLSVNLGHRICKRVQNQLWWEVSRADLTNFSENAGCDTDQMVLRGCFGNRIFEIQFPALHGNPKLAGRGAATRLIPKADR